MNCQEYRSRRREEEAIRIQSQHLVKVMSEVSEVSSSVDSLKQLQYSFDYIGKKHIAQGGGGPTYSTTSLPRLQCSRMSSPQPTSDDGSISLVIKHQTQAQKPFREEPTSLTAPSIDLPSYTDVHTRHENKEATSAGFSLGTSPLPAPENDTSEARDARPSQENDAPLVEDCMPSSEARTDGPALSFMSSVISASPDWPPPNQLAEHQLQLEGIDIAAVHHDDFVDDSTHNKRVGKTMEQERFRVEQCSSLHAGSFSQVVAKTDIDLSLNKEQPRSPFLLPSDPEDTSVLEPICSLDGTSLLLESQVKVHGGLDGCGLDGCGLDPSPSEWIGSDDWVDE